MAARLDPNRPIAVVAPAGLQRGDRLERGLAYAREVLGLHLVVPEPLERPHRYLAGPDDHRLQQLVHALTDPQYGAVWASRGGYGVTRLLPHLPWDDVRPIPVIGFSDLTPLLNVLAARTRAKPWHGPVLHSLCAPRPGPPWPTSPRGYVASPRRPSQGTTWVTGEAAGRLVGGNLAMLAATCGTPWQLDARGAVLFLEDVGEAPYRLDRLWTPARPGGRARRGGGPRAGHVHRLRRPRQRRLDHRGRPPRSGDAPRRPGDRRPAHRPWGRQRRSVPVGGEVRLSDGALHLRDGSTEASLG